MFAALRPDVWPALSARERQEVNMKLTRSGFARALSKDALISSSVKQRPFFRSAPAFFIIGCPTQRYASTLQHPQKHWRCPDRIKSFLPKPGET